MKKIFQFLILFSTVVSFTNSNISFAYDYSNNYSDYYDENTYSVHKEYKTGEYTDENSIFNGCDEYTLETIEAYESLPTLETKYDYIVASDDIIGNWFEYRSSFDKRFGHTFDVKLPLHTGYYLNEEKYELEDSHSYDIYIMWKRVPYISIEADTDSEALFDMEKLNKIYPEIKSIKVNKNEEGNYIYYLSTGDVNTNFSEYESDVDKIITPDDAQKIADFKNEHVIDMSYCSSYDMQHITLSEYPVYLAENIADAVSVFEAYGYSTSVNDFGAIIPHELVSPAVYYEIISEIQKKFDIMPSMNMYENDFSTVVNSKKISDTLVGDANCNGKVEISDAVAILQYLANSAKYPLSAQGLINADFDDDGITGADALAIQKMDAMK